MKVAIIPARGGSKGIKNKNLSVVRGKPLIGICIEVAESSKLFEILIVSTDCEMIAAYVTENYPNVVLLKRPSAISGDHSLSEEAILHAIHEFEKIADVMMQEIVFLQVTSPFTKTSDLVKMVEKLSQFDSVAFYTADYGFHFEIDDLKSSRAPRQIRKPKKREAGNAWAFNAQLFKKYQSRLFGRVGLVEIDNFTAFEIDEPSDLEIANMMSQKLL